MGRHPRNCDDMRHIGASVYCSLRRRGKSLRGCHQFFGMNARWTLTFMLVSMLTLAVAFNLVAWLSFRRQRSCQVAFAVLRERVLPCSLAPYTAFGSDVRFIPTQEPAPADLACCQLQKAPPTHLRKSHERTPPTSHPLPPAEFPQQAGDHLRIRRSDFLPLCVRKRLCDQAAVVA